MFRTPAPLCYDMIMIETRAPWVVKIILRRKWRKGTSPIPALSSLENQTFATFSHLLYSYRALRIRGELKMGVSVYLWHHDNMTGTKQYENEHDWRGQSAQTTVRVWGWRSCVTPTLGRRFDPVCETVTGSDSRRIEQWNFRDARGTSHLEKESILLDAIWDNDDNWQSREWNACFISSLADVSHLPAEAFLFQESNLSATGILGVQSVPTGIPSEDSLIWGPAQVSCHCDWLIDWLTERCIVMCYGRALAWYMQASISCVEGVEKANILSVLCFKTWIVPKEGN